jgi:UDP-N-acetylglucosamine--N-acetylmuramyl-(pentapeptide) pyrophosphoryl-undecaprenol N-acetylglucosamine transferase
VLAIVTGGGTGGHVIPAMIIIKELLKRKYDVIYVGSKKGVEAKIMGGLTNIILLNVGGVKGKGIFEALKSIILILLSFLKMIGIFLKRRPSFIIGVGGFVSVSALLAGVALKIPIYLQEQNAVPGTATKFFAPFAKKIFLGFEDITHKLPLEKSIITGNPLREDFLEPFTYRIFSKDEKMKILILGGSSGAKFINKLILETLPLLDKKRFSFIHQTGREDREKIASVYKEYDFSAEVFDFSPNISSFYKQAHFIISRAGAMTVTEILYLKIPSLFIPYPYAIYDHQARNAEFAKKIGIAYMLRESEIDKFLLAKKLNDLYENPDKLLEMSQSAKSFKIDNPAKKIVDVIGEEVCV